MSNSELKTSFNTAPTLYDEIRPGYPEELISDIVDLSGTRTIVAGFLRLAAALEKRPGIFCRAWVWVGLPGHRGRFDSRCKRETESVSKCYSS